MSSGFSVNVRTNAKEVAFEFMAAAREMRDTAMMRALNKVADQVRTAASREVRAAGFNLKASTIKQSLKVKRASQGNLKATVTASGKPIPLRDYGARQTAKGVTISVLKGRKLIPGAFIATMPNGHTGVFVHKGKGLHKKVRKDGKVSWHQLPIQELFGPSVPGALANKAVQKALQDLVAEKFPSILEHEHSWLARRAARR